MEGNPLFLFLKGFCLFVLFHPHQVIAQVRCQHSEQGDFKGCLLRKNTQRGFVWHVFLKQMYVFLHLVFGLKKVASCSVDQLFPRFCFCCMVDQLCRSLQLQAGQNPQPTIQLLNSPNCVFIIVNDAIKTK